MRQKMTIETALVTFFARPVANTGGLMYSGMF